MTKSKSAENSQVEQVIVEGVRPRKELKIIRKTYSLDDVVEYVHPSKDGKTKNVYSISLYALCDRHFTVLRELIDMRHAADEDKHYCHILTSLIDSFERQIDEVATFIDESIGTVGVDVIGHNSWPYRINRIVGAWVGKPEREFIDHG